MGVVNLKQSNLQIESVSSASSNIEKYVLEGKTFIDGTFEDDAGCIPILPDTADAPE